MEHESGEALNIRETACGLNPAVLPEPPLWSPPLGKGAQGRGWKEKETGRRQLEAWWGSGLPGLRSALLGILFDSILLHLLYL